jgi:predicted alpha/beta-fold hydrolase
VLFHGLEGSAQSHYALLLMALLAARGWRGVIPHFRGCGGEPNLLPRAYHSGDHEESARMLPRCARASARAPHVRGGRSLGGSALLNWIGRAARRREDCWSPPRPVSAPLDLTAAGIAIGQGLNRIYTRYFLRTLKPKASTWRALSRPARHARIARCARCGSSTMRDGAAARLRGADDYWTRASSKRWLATSRCRRWCSTRATIRSCPAHRFRPRRVSRAVRSSSPDDGGTSAS